MNISEIDKDLSVQYGLTEPDMVWHDIKQSPFRVHGVFYDSAKGEYLRMPADVAEATSKNVGKLNRHTSGGRVRFRTNSTYIAIHAVMNKRSLMAHMPLSGQAGFDVFRRLDGKDTFFFTMVPPPTMSEDYSGYTTGHKTYGELTDYTVNFPLYDGVRELYIAIKKDAVLDFAAPFDIEGPVVYYGNSITQGGCASRPGNAYPAILSRRLNCDFVNLGFSGSGKGEQTVARHIATLDMSAFVLDYDSNANSVAELRETHYPFYKTVREAQPDIPIVIISHPTALHAVHYELACDPLLWGSYDERRAVIYETYERARLDGDENVYFINGKDIFRGEEWDACTVDGTHPNDLGFYRFAISLEKVLGPALKKSSRK